MTRRRREIVAILHRYGWATAKTIGTTDSFMQKLIDEGLVCVKSGSVRTSSDPEYGLNYAKSRSEVNHG